MQSKSNLPRKDCQQCGRPIVWRKKWARCWEQITVCSDRCRAARRADSRRQITAADRPQS